MRTVVLQRPSAALDQLDPVAVGVSCTSQRTATGRHKDPTRVSVTTYRDRQARVDDLDVSVRHDSAAATS
jgi:hypothetical protein